MYANKSYLINVDPQESGETLKFKNPGKYTELEHLIFDGSRPVAPRQLKLR